jgi:nitrate reductase delta subunit
VIDPVLKALSLVLNYPTAEFRAASADVGAVLAVDARLPAPVRASLLTLVDEFRRMEVETLEERYVALFDRSRTLSLNLFEHVHGESRDRGAAMVALLETYRAAGYEPATWELPDHLPMLLEFLSNRPVAEARETLADAAHILGALRERLERRDSPYAAVFAALSHLAGRAADRDALAEMLQAPDDDPADLAALDAVWEESEVRFGPDPAAGCPATRAMLARMDPSTAHAAE